MSAAGCWLLIAESLTKLWQMRQYGVLQPAGLTANCRLLWLCHAREEPV